MAAAVAQAPNELQSEIKSVASKLGFAVQGGSFEYDEFSVDVAKQAVSEPDKEEAKGTQGKTGLKKSGKSKKESGKKVKGKQKRVGVEPGPESKTFRSLLGPQEPTVWYEAAEQLPGIRVDVDDEEISDEMMIQRKLTAEAQLEREKSAFEKKVKHDYRDAAYLQKVKVEGTSADRIAALTLSIRESSLANICELEPLLTFMEKRKGSRELVARSMEALGELFRMYLLPDRKLKFFEQQLVHVLTDDSESAKHALYWYVEDLVKRAYARFIAALEVCSCDPLEFLRERSMRLSMNLLAEKPEQEARLLAMLVNRLGDRSKRLGSKVVMYLDVLLQKHPHWKEVVAREVERCTLLPNTPMRVVHYATATLNQMTFDRKKEADRRVAHRLVDFYFTLFKMILDGHIGFRIDMEKKAEMKAKGSKFHKKKFAKKMLNKKQPKQNKNPARSHNPKIEEMDARILNNLIVGVRRAIVHVPAVQCDKLVQDHMDNLFRVVHVAPIGVGIQALTLLFHILHGKGTSGDRLYRALYARLAAPDLFTSSKLPLMVSTLFKAMKNDISLSRMMAFVKRLLQAGATALPGAAAGSVLLLSELMKVHRGLQSAISQPEEDEGEETFDDIGNDANTAATKETASTVNNPVKKKYQIGEREPLHCKAETSCLWELCGYLHHVHPTVSGMARSLLLSRPVEFLGDPLQDLELVSFLDKFQGKEAKSHAEGSVFRPMGGVTGSVTMARVGSKSFEQLEEDAVGVEDLFFHKYYRLTTVKDHRKTMSERRRRQRGKKRVRDDEENDGFNQTDDIEDVLTDEEDDTFEDIEEEMEETDLGKLVQSERNISKDKSSNEKFSYDDLAAAMESDGLSGSDLEMGDSSGDDLPSPAETSSSEGNDAQSSGELDDIDLPTAEFPLDAFEMEESKLSIEDDEKVNVKPKKRRKKGASLFAPAEDYEHLLNG